MSGSGNNLNPNQIPNTRNGRKKKNEKSWANSEHVSWRKICQIPKTKKITQRKSRRKEAGRWSKEIEVKTLGHKKLTVSSIYVSTRWVHLSPLQRLQTPTPSHPVFLSTKFTLFVSILSRGEFSLGFRRYILFFPRQKKLLLTSGCQLLMWHYNAKCCLSVLPTLSFSIYLKSQKMVKKIKIHLHKASCNCSTI